MEKVFKCSNKFRSGFIHINAFMDALRYICTLSDQFSFICLKFGNLCPPNTNMALALNFLKKSYQFVFPFSCVHRLFFNCVFAMFEDESLKI